MFFASEGPEVFVYVENQRPTFTHRAFLNRMECAEETGCDHCGGEDEFGLIYFSVTKTVLNNMAKGDPRELASAMGVYRANFNEGQIRHPEAKVQELSNVKRSDQVFTYFKYYEDDKETVTRTAVIGGIVGLGFATLGVLYESGGAAVAAAATALATERIIAATKGADNLGTREWVTDYWGMSDRISFTHQANFLRDHIANPAASLSVLPKDLPAMSSGDFIPTLLHPIVGYGGAISSVAVECGASGLSCSSGTTCYVNQCIGTSERVGAAANLSWPSGFSSGVTDDPTWNVGYRGRMDLTKGGGRYKGDFEFVICPENDPSSDFTSKQERCQGVD